MTYYEHIEGQTANINCATANETSNINLIARLGLTPLRDGNMWCFLWGGNLQDGIAGFGETVSAAMHDFNKNFYNEKAIKTQQALSKGEQIAGE
jgi:hypothetical protein